MAPIVDEVPPLETGSSSLAQAYDDSGWVASPPKAPQTHY